MENKLTATEERRARRWRQLLDRTVQPGQSVKDCAELLSLTVQQYSPVTILEEELVCHLIQLLWTLRHADPESKTYDKAQTSLHRTLRALNQQRKQHPGARPVITTVHIAKPASATPEKAVAATTPLSPPSVPTPPSAPAQADDRPK
jgi:hypothetical protein